MIIGKSESIFIWQSYFTTHHILQAGACAIICAKSPQLWRPESGTEFGNYLIVSKLAAALLYKFKLHPLDKVRNAASRHFNILGNHEFPVTEPISWSKTIFLLEKK